MSARSDAVRESADIHSGRRHCIQESWYEEKATPLNRGFAVREPAYAKLNLSLDITGRRADGYHLLSMSSISISLHDTLWLKDSLSGLQVHCVCDQALPGAATVPDGPDNLVYRAAKAFFTLTGEMNRNVQITVEKHIPSQAGMGGGSADAAAALRALCRLYTRPLPEAVLRHTAETLGADVPYCLRGGSALVEGVGEQLTPLPELPPCWVVVCKPDFGVDTAAAYRRVDEAGIKPAAFTPGVVAALQAADLTALGGALGNTFEQVLSLPEVTVLKTALLRQGALGACMTGSGSATFGLFAQESSARAAAEVLKQQCRCVFVCAPQPALQSVNLE